MAATDEGNGMPRIASLALAALLLLAAPVAAEDRPALTIYTYDSFAAEWGPGPQLKAGFEAQCGCIVDFVAVEDSIAAFRRVQLEGPATKADIIVGLDNFIAGEARASGLFAPHGLELSGLSLPEAWTDPDFVPFDTGYFAFVYNKETTPTPPTSFEALIALPDDFKIVVIDPRSSTTGLGAVVWLRTAYGDRAPKIWAGLKPHILTMSRGWSEAYGLFTRGEADMAFSFTTSPAYHILAEDDERYAAAIFEEGHIAQIEIAGVLQSSPHQELAREFLTYLVTPEAQGIIAMTNWMYPVIDLGAELPAAFGAPPPKVLPVDEAAVTANRNAWIEEALAAIR
jgi:thiamine transport system substrate-binding protein